MSSVDRLLAALAEEPAVVQAEAEAQAEAQAEAEENPAKRARTSAEDHSCTQIHHRDAT